MTWLDAMEHVLRQNGEPMHYEAITEAIVQQKLRSKFGATPRASRN